MMKTAFTLLLISMLAACSAKIANVDDFTNQVSDSFRTSIKGDGIKLFVYKAEIAADNDVRHAVIVMPDRGHGSKPAHGASSADLEDWTAQIELGLHKTLDMNGYCREGYIELSRNIDTSRGEIRGECNEGASQADMDNFVSYTL